MKTGIIHGVGFNGDGGGFADLRIDGVVYPADVVAAAVEARLPPSRDYPVENGAAEWVQDNLNAIAKRAKGKRAHEAHQLTEFEKRAVFLLARAFNTGVYNLSVDWDKVDWRFGGVGVRFPFSYAKELATWDFNHLTRLVIGAHDECIRASIDGGVGGRMKILMFPRDGREGPMSKCHPTIETAIKDYRR